MTLINLTSLDLRKGLNKTMEPFSQQVGSHVFRGHEVKLSKTTHLKKTTCAKQVRGTVHHITRPYLAVGAKQKHHMMVMWSVRSRHR